MISLYGDLDVLARCIKPREAVMRGFLQGSDAVSLRAPVISRTNAGLVPTNACACTDISTYLSIYLLATGKK